MHVLSVVGWLTLVVLLLIGLVLVRVMWLLGRLVENVEYVAWVLSGLDEAWLTERGKVVALRRE